MRIYNALLIILMLVIVSAVLIRFFAKKYYYAEDEEIVLDDYNIDNLVNHVKLSIEMILKERVEDLNLNKYETEKKKKNKTKLREALRDAPTGDIGAKAYVKDYIQNLLQTRFKINELTVDRVIPFDEPERLTRNDRFSIVLHLYKKKYMYGAMEHLIIENGLDKIKPNGVFEVTEEDIKQVYRKTVKTLKYSDKIEICTQKIYSLMIGHDIADEIRDMKIDGLSSGVSGMSEDMFMYAEEYFLDESEFQKLSFSYDSIWIYFKGKSIHLSCIGYGSQRAFERVCKNIHRYNHPPQLSETKGYVTNELKDGSRITTCRPPFSDSWLFVIRKHGSKYVSVSEWLDNNRQSEDTKKEIPLGILKYIVRGCQVTAITGGQGTGKTSLLRGLIEFILPIYNIRIQELVFELWLRVVYPNHKNIITFKETPTISGQEGLDLAKKMDGDINIMGEVASSAVANWVIQMSQVASLMTMFSHHAKTVRELITWMRDALLKDGGLSSERAAEEEVVHCINFDVHLAAVRIPSSKHYGERYIQRITEIIPLEDDNNGKLYTTKDIMVFDRKKHRYELKNTFSDRALEEIFENLSEEEQEEFDLFFDKYLEKTEEVA